MSESSLHQLHLDRVSRSFAFCIARLPEPLKNYVGLSYLLCRIVDTTEDAIWTNQNFKKNSFIEFQNFLTTEPLPSQVSAWVNTLSENNISSDEKNLISDFYLLLKDFYSLPENIRLKMQKSIICMSKGMSYFSEKYPAGLKLKSLTEVNQYCFFVAGIVGELLTDLMSEFTDSENLPKDIYIKAHHFGLFLQKINILKDQKDDAKNNKFFVHDKEEFIDSLKYNAQNALQYILAVPVQQKEFRLFCSWSLFIGLSSLNWIQNSLLSQVANKIPRWMTEQILNKTENIINDNASLQKLFSELVSTNLNYRPHVADNKISEIFQDFYRGALSPSQLSELLV